MAEGWRDGAGAFWIRARDFLTAPILTIGESAFSLTHVLKFILFAILLLWVSIQLRRALNRRIFPRLQVESGAADTLSNIVGWVVLVFGLLVGLQTAGVKLSALNVVFGAIGIGIGFGLQTVAANFVAGVIILIERPIQVGDRIEVGSLHGRVTRIKLRATEVLTNDNIAVIVPNSEFISQRVINWSRGGNRIRVRIPVHVAYGSDPDVVRRALFEAADGLEVVLKDPAPEVRLTGFGESALQFELLGWTREMLQRRGAFISRVNFAVLDALRRHDIRVPLPQREILVHWPEGGKPEVR